MKARLGIGLLLLFILLVGQQVNGQVYHANQRKIGRDDGLTHYRVLALYPDEEGMWVGTEDGLNFYDGYNWQYWTKDQGQLSNKAINFIQRDPDGALWLFNTSRIESKTNVLSIDILSADGKQIRPIQKAFGPLLPFSVDSIKNFFEAPDHQIYIYAADTLWCYSSKDHFKSIDLPSGFIPHTIFSNGTIAGRLNQKLILLAADGQITTTDYPLSGFRSQIVGDYDKFLVWQFGRHCQIIEPQDGQTHCPGTLFPIQQEKNENFSFLLFDKERQCIGLNKDAEFILCNLEGQRLFSSPIVARRACFDPKDNLWLGKFELLVLHLQKKKFKRYLYQPRFPASNSEIVYQCRGILEKDQKLYVNTYLGTQVIDLKSNIQTNISSGISRNYAFLLDHQDRVWMGYRQLSRLDPSHLQIEVSYEWSNDQRTWSLFEDSKHRIWLGDIGISYFTDGQFYPFDKYNGFDDLTNALVLFFYPDPDGLIWIGSDKGLYRLDPEQGILEHYGKNREGTNYLPSNRFQHMHRDADGIYWLATEDAGLIRWDKTAGKFRNFDQRQGLLTNNLYAVYEDDYNYLWLSTFNGIMRFHKTQETIDFFNHEDGISDNEFNRISHFQAEDGRLYFGSQNGVTAFYPRDFLNEQPETHPFDLIIKHKSIFTDKIWRDTLNDGSAIDLTALSPNTKIIDLEIATSDLFWSDRIELHYSLERQGSGPIKSRERVSADHHIELFDMRPGQYHLTVRAIHKNGKNIGTTLHIPIRITLPFYYSKLFWLGLMLFSCAAIWGVVKIRTHQLQKRQLVLEKMVSERTQQILQDQKTIHSQAELIKSMKEQLNRKEEQWLEQFHSIVNSRLSDPNFYLPDVIDDMEISRSSFYEKVKSLTKMTPNQYIQELRLTKAKHLLDEGNVKTVKEVAFAVGMKQPRYFSKLFKDRFGVLPSAYFREVKSNS